MVLLRRRNWAMTLFAASTTALAYAIFLFWLMPSFLERHYNGKQRLWAQFLASCDCDKRICLEDFNLSMMHGSLYERLMTDSKHGNRSVIKHLVWQPHKVAAAYPWRLRMFAHMALVLPRSMALGQWWLAGAEDMTLAMRHLAQGVPLVLDPDSLAVQRVEPDASILCKLDESKPESKPMSDPRDPGKPPHGQEQRRQEAERGRHQGSGVSSGGGPGRGDMDALGAPADGAEDGNSTDSSGGSDGGKRQRKAAAPGPDGEDDVRRFTCTLHDVRGAAALLRLLPLEELAPVMGRYDGASRRDGAPPSLPLPLPTAPEPHSHGPSKDAPADGAAEGGGNGGGYGEGQCSYSTDGQGGTQGSCPAPPVAPSGAAAAAAADSGGEKPASPVPQPASPVGGGDEGAGSGAKSRGAGGRSRDHSSNIGGGGACRNFLFVRPPRQSEVSEHVRELEASPLGMGILELLRASLPRVAEVTSWLLLPHVMFSRYFLLLAQPPPLPSPAAAAAAAAQGRGAGIRLVGGVARGLQAYFAQMPRFSVGLQLMLAAGALLTFVELQLFARVVSELLSLARPRRSWARRREVALCVLYEGMFQPLREAVLAWNITHYLALPLLQLMFAMSSLDMALVFPLFHCVLTLGAANSDVAARATSALLRVAQSAREHQGGHNLLLLNVVAAAEPKALPYIVRLVRRCSLTDPVGQAGRAAVVAAILEEAPGLAAALAAAAAAPHAGGEDGGAGDGGGEMAAAMQARVAAGLGGHQRRGAGGAEENAYESDDEDDDDDDEAEGSGGEGNPVVLRWPVPLQLPPEAADWEDVPRGFTCAITQTIMTQPAMLVSPELAAAPTYERSAIQQWLSGQMRDPKSNTPLQRYSLLPNEDLHRAIDDWVAQRLRAAQQPPRRARTRRRATGRTGSDGHRAMASDAAAAGAGAGAALPPIVEGEVVDAAHYGGGDDDDGGGMSPSHSLSGDDSDSFTQSCRSVSVLASLAHGASSLMDTGVEVMSRAAAVAATAVAAATAAAGGAARRAKPESDGAGPSDEALDQDEE